MTAVCLSLLPLFDGEAQTSYSGLSTATGSGASRMSPGVPPSSYEGGLVNTPNPIDGSANAVMDGNVRGGKQFRAPVPYDPPTSFHGSLGSTRLDSFMRYSAVPQESGGYVPGYESFYSPTGTVSQMLPGQTGVMAPTSPRVAGGIGQWRTEQPADVMDLGDVHQPRLSTGQTSAASEPTSDAWRKAGTWSLGGTPEQMREMMPDDTAGQFADSHAARQNDPALTSDEYQRQMNQFQQQLEKIKADASRLEQSLRVGDALPQETSKQAVGDPMTAASSRTTIDNLMRPPSPSQPSNLERRGEPDLLLKTPDAVSREGQSPMPDMSGITNLVTPPSAAVQTSPTGDAAAMPGMDAATRTNRIAELFSPRGQSAIGTAQKPGNPPAYAPTGPTNTTILPPDPTALLMTRQPSTPVEADIPTQADANELSLVQPKPSGPLSGDPGRAKYDTPSGSSLERLDRYLKAADAYMQKGQYARAAESYSLASLYSPGDRRVHFGRSRAMFAVGDYASSAAFLAKAIEVDPDGTLAKQDLVETMGGPDLFVQRITELEQGTQAGAKPQVQLLLAYIYYEMDRPQEAKAAVDAAEKGLPHLRAVTLLKAAIEK